MSYLDNLENSLKNMEAQEERGSSRRDHERIRKETERAKAAATAPFAEQLRRGPFTTELMNEAVRIGYGLRAKVYITWIDGALRLEARGHRLELKATPEGVLARSYAQGNLLNEEIVNLNGSAKKLAERWLNGLKSGPGS